MTSGYQRSGSGDAHRTSNNPLVEIVRHALYRGHQVDSEKFDWQPADTALTQLRRIEEAAREFLTACDEYGCSDAPLDQYATLVEAVSGLPDGREPA